MSAEDFIQRVHDMQNKINEQAGFSASYDRINHRDQWRKVMSVGDGSSIFEQMGGKIVNPKYPKHTHDDDGTVEGCPGCFQDEPVTGKTSRLAGPVVKWADEAMYSATPMSDNDDTVRPRVTIISMTPDPLRVMAAAAQLYKGDVVYRPSDIPQAMAIRWLEDMGKTALNAALEFIDVHMLIEGVTRAFTHQLVRQRTAVYVQESMRFAVKENAAMEVAMPPSIAMLKDDDPRRTTWTYTVDQIGWAYNALVDSGVPAEDARGILPTNITTRVHYKTTLRGLAEHSGLRLCSQAQYEWKQVWAEIIEEIVMYGPPGERWQQIAIAGMFKPVCYQTGRCEFRGEADRYCSIRERVEAHHERGESPDTWNDINPLEPLYYGAARKAPGD